MARFGRAADRCQAGARPGRVRVPDVARRRRATRRPTRPRRTSAAHLRPVRRALVRLLAAAPAGEPEDRRLHRRGHARAARAAPQRLRLIWAEAEGCRVVDADGREYLDLSAGFGVAALGHRNPKILEAWRAQPVVHALGDLADTEVTVKLRERLPRPSKLGVTGEDAVEIALRTALLATGKPGILAFEGAYHGTGLLALAATSIDAFRLPFRTWLPGPVYRRRFGDDPGTLPARCGCVIVEPVQARGGAQVPSPDFLRVLRRRCTARGALLIVDAIYAGLGRTGELWPGAEYADVLVVGKALGHGLPISAALFCREGLEQVWELGDEDVYTHTHVGNPLASAAALVVLDEVPGLLDRVREAGDRFEREGWHGKGLLRAREGDAEEALSRGVIVVPAGPGGRLISATPPLTITDAELDEAFERLA